MKTFQKLRISGDPEEIDSRLKEIATSLRSGWSHNIERENELKKDTLSEKGMYCFHCSESQSHPSANLWFAESEPGQWYNSNIVPDKVSRLDFDQYNTILNEFYDLFIKPLEEEQDVEVSISPAEASIENWVSSDTAKLLKIFSSAANRTVLHWMDEERWYDFVIAAHRENADLDPDYLERWLREDEQWPEDMAYELAMSYEKSRSLLEYYDKNR